MSNSQQPRLIGQYKIGDVVRVLTLVSDYYLCHGTVAEVSQFNDHGVITFAREAMALAPEPWKRDRLKGRCHFYWRELQEISF